MMGPSRGDTICGNVAIEALGPMHFGALALGPIHFARNPSEPRIWLVTVERTLLPRSVDVSRFMAGVGELASRKIAGTVPLVLVDREADFCVVGYRVIEGARTLATIAEQGIDDAAARVLGVQLAQTLAALHASGVVHGLLTPTTVVHDGTHWLTWEYGIAGLCAPDRLAPRLRPLGGDVVAPELRAGGEVSPASDMFGWGAAVACLLTGSSGSDAVAMLQDSDASDALCELVRACLDPIPEMRPRDAATLIARLAEIAPSLAVAAPNVASSDSTELSFAEFSFAELNEPVAAAGAASISEPRPSETHEIVELLSLGDDEDDDSIAAPTPADSAESWRELAEEYLSPPAQASERTPLPVAELEQVSPTDRRNHEALGRVALVKTRVRTGPQKPAAAMDHVVVSGEFEMSAQEEPDPPPPRVAEGAPDLPLGSPDEDDWDDPEAAVFDLDAPGSPRVEVEHEDIDPDPGPSPWPTPLDGEGRERPVSWSEPTPVDGLRTRQAVSADAAPPAPRAVPPPPPPQVVLPTLREPTPEPIAIGELLPPPREAATPRRETPAPRAEPPAPRSEIALPATDHATSRAEPSAPRLPLVEAPAVPLSRARTQSNDSIPGLDRAPSRPHPIVPLATSRTPSRPQPILAELSTPSGRQRSGAWLAWSIAVLAGAMAISATLAAARQAGGLSRLLAGGAAVTEPTTPTDGGESPAAPAAPPTPAAHEECPATTRPIEGTRVCIDEAEAPGLGERPSTKVSLADARAACAERGAQLCTTQQWRAACRGPHNWRHPYGSRAESERCNGAAPSGALQDLSRTGARDGCVTPTGVYDLEGNVGEWVAEGAVLGGDSSTRSPSCDSRTQPSAGTSSPSTGYRCCIELAEPTADSA